MPAPAPFPYQFNVQRSQSVWDDLIKKHGELSILRQPNQPDRWIIGMVGQFTSLERMGQVSNPTDRKAIISMISPDTGEEIDPPPSEKDVYVTLVLDDSGAPTLDAGGLPQTLELLKIVAPPTPIGNNRKKLYWRLQVRA